ncbi:MAG: diguanylate cyclase [Treponema sp.]|nr:diguanylate cyclase [Treponema sp.]
MDKIQEYLEHIHKLLHDNRIPELRGELAEDSLLLQIHDELKIIREVLFAFSSGDFSSAISIRGIIPGCLKSLQAHLRHLIWQVQMVEKGDFSQEVRFMGEFSTAFNSMVQRLNLSLSKLQEKEETLLDINNKLRKEVKRMEILRESEARFKFLASHDPLTGILNRRSFIEMAGVELANAIDLCVPCCFAMMDVDHFKDFNDAYGHLAGDEALRHVVRIVEEGLRKNDFMGRYGGEEFILFFYGADEKTGMKVLERLRTRLSGKSITVGTGSVTIHASFGLAGSNREKPEEKGYIQRLIDDADTALYAAKMAGRNRVMLYNPEQETRRHSVISNAYQDSGLTEEDETL